MEKEKEKEKKIDGRCGGRRRRELKLIESSKIRKATFLKRRDGLIKKAMELQTLCDVPTLVVCLSDDTADVKEQLTTWPEDRNRVLGLVARYAGINQFERSRWRQNTESLMKTQIDKTTSDIQKKQEEFRRLLDAKIEAVDRRISQLLHDQEKERERERETSSCCVNNGSQMAMNGQNNDCFFSSDDYDYDYDMLMKSICKECDDLFATSNYEQPNQMTVYDNSSMNMVEDDDRVLANFDQQQLQMDIYHNSSSNMFPYSDELNSYSYVCNEYPCL